MKRIDTPLTVEGKGQKNKQSHKGKSFGYQVLGFGAGNIIRECFICASGGCITTDGDFKIHEFNSPGTFTINNHVIADNSKVNYVILAGGGGGAAPQSGGGGGGFRTNFPSCGYTVAKGAFSITVGAGGAGKCSGSSGPGTKGDNSIAVGLTAAGGGAGDGDSAAPACVTDGGSGGGGYWNQNGHLGNVPDTSPVDGSPQGNNGGQGAGPISGQPDGQFNPGGGGGAGSVGGTGGCITAGGGGNGRASTILGSGSPFTKGGGGGGGSRQNGGGGPGGPGGGGSGGRTSAGSNGTANTGGGGGGGGLSFATRYNGGNGGSGIVYIRYKYQ